MPVHVGQGGDILDPWCLLVGPLERGKRQIEILLKDGDRAFAHTELVRREERDIVCGEGPWEPDRPLFGERIPVVSVAPDPVC